MEVRYADPDLRDLCASDRALRRKYGAVCARRIATRLRTLEAADSVDDLMRAPGRCHPLNGTYYGDCFAFRLHGGLRLVFRLLTDEERKAQEIPDDTAALVVEIIDYHEG
ncbi:killer suppression protein HigA [Actinomadura sp. GC306]|uniref:type II toxin-antitoxin system RelE/ParE family toxin n=1 Tax=Actinomadura sp. GC306 TaxID=2530367 RepID=UPI00104CF795|nr:killer suppression protein HigA [Actinomadura sp. GC306]TDC61295.1 killer suppression protein HigA [Actinomadura sp. GC306]